MDNYKSMIDKISASDSFKESTQALLINESKVENKKHHSPRLVPVLAACLAVIIMLTIFLVPFDTNSQHSFTIKASAESLVTDSDFTPIADISAAQLGFIGLDLSEIAPILDGDEAPTDDPKLNNKAFFSLYVEGENIESIHFDLNDGFFEVEDGVTHKIIESSGKMENHTVGMMDGFSYFEAITFSYSNQITPIGEHYEGDWLTMNVLHSYDENTDKELLNDLLNLSVFKPDGTTNLEDEEYFERTFENFLNEMYKDTEIYVTCKFTDGKELTKTLKLYADCEIIGMKEEYYFTGDSYTVDNPENEKDQYEIYEVYDYTVKLCAKIV